MKWTKAEDEVLAGLVEREQPLAAAAVTIERPFGEVLQRVADLGIRSPARPGPPPKIPRGAGYSKREMVSAAGALISFDGTIIEWARSQKLNPDLLYHALFDHEVAPLRYIRAQLDLRQECAYCTRLFFATNASQDFCSRKCGADARRDESYFGGRRRDTIGLLAGICQVCGAHPHHGISSHHVLGKENDPENEFLIAVCSGCHDLITRLTRRLFGEGEWDALISLCQIRRTEGATPALVRVALSIT